MRAIVVCNLHLWVTLIIFTCYAFITFLFYKTRNDDVILQSYTFYAALVITGILIMAKEVGLRVDCTMYILCSNLINIVWTYSIVFDGSGSLSAADEIFVSFLTYSMITSIISVTFVILEFTSKTDNLFQVLVEKLKV